MYKYSMYGKTDKINSLFFRIVVFIVETLFLFVYKIGFFRLEIADFGLFRQRRTAFIWLGKVGFDRLLYVSYHFDLRFTSYYLY